MSWDRQGRAHRLVRLPVEEDAWGRQWITRLIIWWNWRVQLENTRARSIHVLSLLQQITRKWMAYSNASISLQSSEDQTSEMGFIELKWSCWQGSLWMRYGEASFCLAHSSGLLYSPARALHRSNIYFHGHMSFLPLSLPSHHISHPKTPACFLSQGPEIMLGSPGWSRTISWFQDP